MDPYTVQSVTKFAVTIDKDRIATLLTLHSVTKIIQRPSIAEPAAGLQNSTIQSAPGMQGHRKGNNPTRAALKDFGPAKFAGD